MAAHQSRCNQAHERLPFPTGASTTENAYLLRTTGGTADYWRASTPGPHCCSTDSARTGWYDLFQELYLGCGAGQNDPLLSGALHPGRAARGNAHLSPGRG